MASQTLVRTATGAPANTSPALSEFLTQARDQAIHRAGGEIAALAIVLRRELDSDEFEWVASNALQRIEALGNVVCTLFLQEREGEILESYQIVFGEKLEAQHG